MMSAARGFEPILDVARQMEQLPHPWFVCGGWAIDLFLNRVTRNHGDREIGIVRRDQFALQEHFKDRALFKADESQWHPWPTGERLELPIHQIMVRAAGRPAPEGHYESRADDFEIFLNEAQDQMWWSRRDRRIERPIQTIAMRSAVGIPILAPEIQLLYKAKHTRPKDEQDFANVREWLDSQRRQWLRDALKLVHPDHVWLSQL
jgi:hypothetical protein